MGAERAGQQRYTGHKSRDTRWEDLRCLNCGSISQRSISLNTMKCSTWIRAHLWDNSISSRYHSAWPHFQAISFTHRTPATPRLLPFDTTEHEYISALDPSVADNGVEHCAILMNMSSLQLASYLSDMGYCLLKETIYSDSLYIDKTLGPDISLSPF